MKIGRLLVGAIIVIFAIWVIVGEQMSGASANAVINARLSTVRAPIAGEIALPDRELGSSVSRGEVLAAVSDPLVDAVRRNDLEMERVLAATEVERLSAHLDATRAVAVALEDRSTRFTERQIAELELRLQHAQDRLGLLGLEADPEGASLAGGPASLEDSRAREEVEVLENALAAARSGVFIGDGYNDAPNAEQRRVDLVTVINGLEADLEAAQGRLTALTDRADAERLAVNRLTEAEMSATVSGRIWDVLAADGERLQRGEPVLRLVDCETLIVTLSVTENVYNRLRVGDAGQFRLSGSGETYAGTVARLAGSGASTIYGNLAVAPSEQQLERFDVALTVPGLTTDPDLTCPVGRTGRAFFEERPLDWLRSLF